MLDGAEDVKPNCTTQKGEGKTNLFSCNVQGLVQISRQVRTLSFDVAADGGGGPSVQ